MWDKSLLSGVFANFSERCWGQAIDVESRYLIEQLAICHHLSHSAPIFVLNTKYSGNGAHDFFNLIGWTLKGLELCNNFFVDFSDLNSLSRVRLRSPWLRLLDLSSYRSFRLPGSALALARTVGRASSLCSKSGLARLHFHWRLFDRRLRPAHRRRLNASTITNDFLHCNSLA